MAQLDHFIRDNMQRFNDLEPFEGHEDRFAARLDARDSAENRSRRLMILRIAALVVFVFLLSFVFLREYRLWNESSRNLAQIDQNTEILEAERYYSEQLQQYYRQIEELPFQNNRTEKRLVLQELQAMDQQVEMMKEDLRQYPDNEMIINAIINFYQIKIELMSDIIARVQNLNQTL